MSTEIFVAVPETVDDKVLYEVQIMVNNGNRLYHTGHYQEAWEYYNNALREAASCFKSINEISPAGKMLIGNLHNRRAATSSKLQNYEQVLADSKEMITLGFLVEKAYVREGGAYLALGKPELARQSYLKAVQLNPENEAYKQYLKQAEEQCKEVAPIEQGGASTTKAPESSLVEQIHKNTSKGNRVFFAEKPDFIEALERYNTAIEHASQLPADTVSSATRHNLLGRRAQTLHRLSRFEDAIQDAERMIDIAPHSEKGYILKANAYICLAQETLGIGLRQIQHQETRTRIQQKLNALEAALV